MRLQYLAAWAAARRRVAFRRHIRLMIAQGPICARDYHDAFAPDQLVRRQ